MIVFLDEPSTGMDPKSRRFMWEIISTTIRSRSVILTTHSMEECEALCQRIGIMVAGQLQCIGSAQRLKDRFGNGFQLDVNVDSSRLDELFHFIDEQFPGSVKLEIQGSTVKYRIPYTAAANLAALFRIIEENRAGLGIREYSASNTSLEQIFLYFARGQTVKATNVLFW